MGEPDWEVVNLCSHPSEAAFQGFIRLYLEAFPDPNEREAPAELARRVLARGPRERGPLTHLLVVRRESSGTRGPEVLGGVVCEYYSPPSCGLLAYIAVARSYRRRGLARRLLHEAARTLEQEVNQQGHVLRAMFAEAHDPRKVPASADIMLPADRMSALARLGAKWIDIPYVQPAIAPGKQRVRDLLLLVFPALTGLGMRVPTGVVRAFLRQYFRTCGVADLDTDPDLQRMTKSLLGAEMALRELPR